MMLAAASTPSKLLMLRKDLKLFHNKEKNMLKLIQYLVQNKADVDKISDNGRNALSYAIEMRYVSIVKFLLPLMKSVKSVVLVCCDLT